MKKRCVYCNKRVFWDQKGCDWTDIERSVVCPGRDGSDEWEHEVARAWH